MEKVVAINRKSGTQNFKAFIKQFKNDGSALSDLAEDVLIDVDFPSDDDEDIIENYLRDNNACEGALSAFRTAWRIYKE